MNNTKPVVKPKLKIYASTPWLYGRAAPSKPETEDKFMALALKLYTQQAKSLTKALEGPVVEHAKRVSATSKLRLAMAAVLGDLLSAANQSLELFSFRPLGKGEFAGQRIGYQPAKDTLDAFVALGLSDHRPGFKCGMNRYATGQATRYRATTALLKIALAHGITPANWSSHYRYAPKAKAVVHPIIVRGKREYWHRDDKGPKLSINKSDPVYITAAKQVQDLNAYMAAQTIGGCLHLGFHRIFNHGDQKGFNYNMGGRLYPIGGGYQNMPSKDRAGITINGEATIELDVRASHVTVLHALAGVPLDPAHDPYAMPWLPRDVVKGWMTMTLGYGGFQQSWSKETRGTLLEKKGINLDEYPIDQVRSAVLAHHPVLEGWPNSRLGWPELQYWESQAIIGAVFALAFLFDVAALPVHDSLIVPRSKLMLAKRVLEESFEREIGAKPVLTIKENGRTLVL